MDFGTVLVLIGVGVSLVAMTLAIFSRLSYPRLATIGVALGVLFWAIEAVVIFRGPDNPDLGETGWTIVVGILAGLYVAAWLSGAAVGWFIRNRRLR